MVCLVDGKAWERNELGIFFFFKSFCLLYCDYIALHVLIELCRHKALKDLKDEIFNRHINLRDMASGLVLSNRLQFFINFLIVSSSLSLMGRTYSLLKF